MITIFTPTYNRAYKLTTLFESLTKQTFKDFEWLIVDDGSTDNTKQMVEGFIKSSNFSIRYFYKQNEGKHVAINYAAELALGELFFIVDSDDLLPPNSLKIINSYYLSIKDDASFAGVAGLKANYDKDIVGNYFKDKVLDATAIDFRYKNRIKGDKAEVVRTAVIKKYKFKKIPGENFMQESVLWLSIANDGYKFRWFNEIVYICEYIADGLTVNGKEVAKKNCISRSYADNHIVGIKKIPILFRMKSLINYYRYGIYGKKTISELYNNSNSKTMSLVTIPISLILKIK